MFVGDWKQQVTARARHAMSTVICVFTPVRRRRDAESQQLVARCATHASGLVRSTSPHRPQRSFTCPQATPNSGPAKDCHPQQALLPRRRLGVGGSGMQCGGACVEPRPATGGRRSATVGRRQYIPHQRGKRRYVEYVDWKFRYVACAGWK